MFAIRNSCVCVVGVGKTVTMTTPRRNFFTFVDQHEKGLLFKSGRYVGEKPPGFRLYFPVLHEVETVDMRTQAMQIPSQELMTRDNVTIHVDAVAFFKIIDAFKALRAVKDYLGAVSEVAQTSLRGQLSNATFNEVLHDREEAGKKILAALNITTSAWGVQIDSVQLKNIRIDKSMIRAMGRRAEAERVREARNIEASAEFESSIKLVEAAKQFERAPLALRLRELQTFTQISAEKNTVLMTGNADARYMEALVALKRREDLRERKDTVPAETEAPVPQSKEFREKGDQGGETVVSQRGRQA